MEEFDKSDDGTAVEDEFEKFKELVEGEIAEGDEIVVTVGDNDAEVNTDAAF